MSLTLVIQNYYQNVRMCGLSVWTLACVDSRHFFVTTNLTTSVVKIILCGVFNGS